MSSFSFRVHADWLTITGKYRTDDTIANLKYPFLARLSAQTILYTELGIDGIELSQSYKGAFYSDIFATSDGCIKVSLSDNLKQGFKIELSGKFFTLGLLSESDLINRIAKKGLTITRLDVAVDLYNSSILVQDVFDDIRPDKQVVTMRQMGLINGVSGDTLTIGSRTSQFYMRLYDKGAEQKTDLDWLRIELEIKHEAAKGMLYDWDTIQREASGKMLEMIDGHHSVINDALYLVNQGTAKMTGKKRKTKTNTELWFEKTVKPALRKMWDKDKQAFERVRVELIDLLMGVHYEE